MTDRYYYFSINFAIDSLISVAAKRRGMRALAASYVGLPNMVNAMIELLHAASYRKREIQSMVEDHLKSLVLRHFDPKKADLIFTEEGSVSVS